MQPHICQPSWCNEVPVCKIWNRSPDECRTPRMGVLASGSMGIVKYDQDTATAVVTTYTQQGTNPLKLYHLTTAGVRQSHF